MNRILVTLKCARSIPRPLSLPYRLRLFPHHSSRRQFATEVSPLTLQTPEPSGAEELLTDIDRIVTLRPYQQQCIEACLLALSSGISRMGVSMPTVGYISSIHHKQCLSLTYRDQGKLRASCRSSILYLRGCETSSRMPSQMLQIGDVV